MGGRRGLFLKEWDPLRGSWEGLRGSRTGSALVVEAGDGVDGELAVERLQLFEVAPVLGTPRETLEADDAAKPGNGRVLGAHLSLDGAPSHRVVIQRWQPSTHDVDDAVAAAYP